MATLRRLLVLKQIHIRQATRPIARQYTILDKGHAKRRAHAA